MFTTVLGVDKKHLQQLCLTWPTWLRYKRSLLNHPLVVFYDSSEVTLGDCALVVGNHPHVRYVPWPLSGVEYPEGEGKWFRRQRYKMLAGFVHVPAVYVETPYWLKIDTDTVAVGQDVWIDEGWFIDEPDIIAHPWGFTKPANQMVILDDWADGFENFFHPRRLNLYPQEGSSRIGHPRIISWLGFFNTQFARTCAEIATLTCGKGLLPVPSQDGYMWFCSQRLWATRHGARLVRHVNMKERGWEHWHTMANLQRRTREVLA